MLRWKETQETRLSRESFRPKSITSGRTTGSTTTPSEFIESLTSCLRRFARSFEFSTGICGTAEFEAGTRPGPEAVAGRPGPGLAAE